MHIISFVTTRLGIESSAVVQKGPKEASVLPVSDKPVTLSFNKPGSSMNKPAATGQFLPMLLSFHLTMLFPGVSSAKIAPVKLGFSLVDLNTGEGTDEQDEQDANMGDTKGLSHTLRYTRMISRMCVLTLRHMQFPRPRRFLH